MKSKSIIAMFACVLVAALLLGSTGVVSLAREEESVDAAAQQEKDRLIGIFVTTDHLDLFDFEGYLNDNLDQVLEGGEISVVDSAEYNGRLYATLVEETLTDAESGRTSTSEKFVFEGVEGFLYYEAKVEKENETYYTSSGDEAISDGHLGITVNDAGESIDMKGTIYMSNLAMDGKALYFNPVYQTAEGDVYTIAGHGYSYSGVIGEGGIGTVTLEEKNSYTIDGETTEVGTTIEMSYAFMYPPVKIIVTQMDGENQIVESQEYEPGKVPEKLAAANDTEYFIVETVKQDQKGEEICEREMYQKEDDSLETFFCREDGICVEKWTSLEWEE